MKITQGGRYELVYMVWSPELVDSQNPLLQKIFLRTYSHPLPPDYLAKLQRGPKILVP